MNAQLKTSVVIPTFRRPDGLKRAIESVLKQKNVDWRAIEIVVVDNDPDRSAHTLVQGFQGGPYSINYVHEPEPGVANARNTAIDSVTGSLIAFLDDDQSAPPFWLSRLFQTYSDYKAAVTFGPVDTALPKDGLDHEEYLSAFFSRKGPDTSGLIDDFYGCGNSMLDLSQMPNARPLFDLRANESGGEDDFLFSTLKSSGKTFGWAADANVFEHVPENRAKLSYTLRRSFGYGQGPTTICARKCPSDVPGVLFWMGVGLGQTVLFGSVSAVMFLTRSKRRAFWYDRTSQALGKLFWFKPFEQKFYGQHAI